MSRWIQEGWYSLMTLLCSLKTWPNLHARVFTWRQVINWGLRYPGVKHVEHVYFYTVPTVDAETRRSYLERSYQLGKEFSQA